MSNTSGLLKKKWQRDQPPPTASSLVREEGHTIVVEPSQNRAVWQEEGDSKVNAQKAAWRREMERERLPDPHLSILHLPAVPLTKLERG